MNTSKTRGTQQLLLATLKHPHKDRIGELLAEFARRLSEMCCLTPIRYDHQHYYPIGQTLTVYLAESHLILETYPEDGLVELEIASCRTFPHDGLKPAAEKFGFKVLSSTLLMKTSRHQWRRS